MIHALEWQLYITIGQGIGMLGGGKEIRTRSIYIFKQNKNGKRWSAEMNPPPGPK